MKCPICGAALRVATVTPIGVRIVEGGAVCDPLGPREFQAVCDNCGWHDSAPFLMDLVRAAEEVAMARAARA